MNSSKLRAHIDAELSDAQIQELENRMLEKRQELAERIETLEEQLLTRDDCSHADAADAASAQESRLRAGGMVEQHRKEIGQINVALRRMQTGSYGVNAATGEPIGFARLRLVPWAQSGAEE